MVVRKTLVVGLLAALSVCYADDLFVALEDPFACGHTSCSRDELRQNCTRILGEIANASLQFERCALMKTLPFRMCESCVKYYGYAVTLFRKIETDKTDPTMALCREQFFSSSKVSVVHDTLSYVRGLWNKASCDNCFDRLVTDNSTYQLSNDTVTFNEKLDDVFRCVNSTMVNYPEDNSTMVCTLCKEVYEELNRFYVSLVDGSGHGSICFETVAAMNRTRILWASKHCSVRKFSSLMVYVTAALVGLMAFLYYVCAFCSINPRNTVLVQRTLFIRRRLSTMSSYGQSTTPKRHSASDGSIQ